MRAYEAAVVSPLQPFLGGSSLNLARGFAAPCLFACPLSHLAIIAEKRRENAALFNSILEFAERARQVDEDFYSQHLAAIRYALVQSGVDETEVGRIT
jgi:hypothetical protein